VDVIQIIRGALLIRDALLARLPGGLGDVQSIVQFAALIAHSHPQVRGLDGLGEVELKASLCSSMMLTDGERPCVTLMVGWVIPQMVELFSPSRKAVGVFEGDFGAFSKVSPPFKGEVTAVEGEGVVRERVPLVGGRVIAAVPLDQVRNSS
jgi:hypothetical protein